MKKTISVLLVCILLLSTSYTGISFAAYDSLPFTDVYHSNGSGYLNIKRLYEMGIVEGKTATKFAPKDSLTREEVAKIIVKAAGVPLTDKTGTYSDVVSGSWYEAYAETASSAGLIQGIGDGKFGTGQFVTRQDAAVLASRLAEYKKIKLYDVSLYDIPDIDTVSEYARSAVKLLVNMDVADLTEEGVFDPLTNITRVDFCRFIDRVLASDTNAYDDYLNDWMPEDKDIEDLKGEILVYEDFENGLTSLSGHDYSINPSNHAENNIVKDMGKDSQSSLKLVANSSVKYVEMYFNDITPGETYFYNWDIKTDLPEDALARVTFQWRNASGEIWGNYGRNNDIYGVNDWTNQSFTSPAPSPDTSPKCLRIFIAVNGADEGTIWIDNFKIYKVLYEPLTTYLKKPAYKGVITDPNGEGDIRVTSYLHGLGTIINPEDHHLVADLSDFDGKSYFNTELDELSEEVDITFSSKTLAIGDYDLSVKLIENSTGEIVGENHWVIRKRAKDYMPKYYFDEHGRLLKNGEPHFVLGAYALGLDETVAEDFKDTPVNFIIANSLGRHWQEGNHLYKKFADYGIDVMMSAEHYYMDAIRGQYRDGDITNIASERVALERVVDDLNLTTEEAHIGYQINNESPATEWADRMRWHQQILSEIDIDHLTYGVGAGGKKAAIEYARSHDIYASDPYPITGADTDEIWLVYEDAKGLAEGTENRPVWVTVQISDLKVMGTGSYLTRERGPNETELRNMAWQAICAGAQGVIWYAHFHLDKAGVSRPKEETFPEVLRVSEELNEYKNVIMSVEDAPDVKLSSDIPDRTAHLVRRYDGKTYVFLVNMSKERQNVGLTLNDAASVYGAYSKQGYTLGTGGKVNLTMDGLGVEILIVDQIDQPSPDCEIRDVQFTNGGNNSYFIAKQDDENILYIPEGAETLHYNVDIHPDARIIVNGCPGNPEGKFSLSGKDSVRFTVIAEDGQHWKQTWYKIVRTSGKE